MNLSETANLVTVFDRMRPAFADWRADQAAKLAAMHGTSAREEAKAMLAGMARTLADIDNGEAADVLAEMETGALPIPPYGDLSTTIRTHALEARRGRREAERLHRENEPRYRCLDCHDTGHVDVYNPAFLRWLRPTFETRRRTGLTWYYRARSEWNRLVVQAVSDGVRGQQAAPAEIGLVCRCDCPDALVFRRQLHAMVESLNSRSEKPKRAAYIGQWTPDRQCIIVDHADELVSWYSDHDDQQDFTWQPDPADYAERYGA